jgi:hypothetical protein
VLVYPRHPEREPPVPSFQSAHRKVGLRSITPLPIIAAMLRMPHQGRDPTSRRSRFPDDPGADGGAAPRACPTRAADYFRMIRARMEELRLERAKALAEVQGRSVIHPRRLSSCLPKRGRTSFSRISRSLRQDRFRRFAWRRCRHEQDRRKFRLCARIATGRTMVIVSHRLASLTECDQI